MSAALPYFVWPIILIACWALAHFAVFRPLLAKIGHTTGSTASLADPKTPDGPKIMLWLDGSKTLIASFALSVFATLKSLMDVLSQNTDILDQIKADFPWGSFMSADAALRIVGFALIVISFLHLWGKWTAAKSVPQS